MSRAPRDTPASAGERVDDALRTAGLRVTEGRVAVLEALVRSPHSDADALYRLLSDSLPTTSRQSMHNILGDLADAGLVRKIEPAGSTVRYERRINDNHHHVVCTGCGAIQDVDCVVGHAPCLTPSETNGFAVRTAEVTFWGMCATCQAAGSPDLGATAPDLSSADHEQ